MDHHTPIFSKNQAQKDPIILIKKYLNLLVQKKYLILLITISFGIIWIIFYSMFLKKPHLYTASAVLRFEDDPRYSARVSAVTDFAQMQTESKLAVLNTKPFLEKVVDSLKYNLILVNPGIDRSKLFKKIEISDSALYGIYSLYYEKNNMKLFYTNKTEKIENKIILTRQLDNQSNIYIDKQGFKLVFDRAIIPKRDELRFMVIPLRGAVGRLNANLQASLDRRTRSILTITYSDFEPNFTAQVTNTVANLFIQQLLEYKRFRTKSVLESLEGQLRVAKTELERSENKLRQFRERNPFLFLSTSGQTVVSELGTQQQDLMKVQQTFVRLSNLAEQKNESGAEDKSLIYQEILSALENTNLSGIAVLSERYNRLITEKNNLLSSNYSPQHPTVLAVDMQIEDLQKDVDQRLSQSLNQFNNQISDLQTSIGNTEINLKKLPRNELLLAELKRDKEVKENIYSSILIRYNEAKVSDASVIPDAYIIDRAESPRVYYGGLIDKAFYLIGFMLGFFIVVGTIIGLDFIDKTVKEADTVQNTLQIRVLATLPVIGEVKEIPDILDSRKKTDPKLITSDYAPHVAGESFRLLRTKLMMENQSDHSSIIVASLNPGEGKSLVSSNLAVTFAQQKISTLIIDCDLRRGVLHNTFAVDKKPGLADALMGSLSVNFEDLTKMIQKTHIPNLHLLSNGIQVPNPSELLGSNRMKEIYNLLKKDFGAIIFDTPPIEFISDALVLSNFVNQMVLVVRYGKTNLTKLNDKIQEFQTLKNNLMGVVINASSELRLKKYSSYSYYQY